MKTRESICFVTTKVVRRVVDVVGQHENCGFTELHRHSPVKGGSFYNALRDAQNYGFVSNGGSFRLTELGNQFVKYPFDSDEAKNILKQATQNVLLFKRCYQELPAITNYFKIREWLLNNVNINEFEERLIGAATRRYLENMYGIKVNVRPHTSRRRGKRRILNNLTMTGGGGGGGNVTLPQAQDNEAYLFEILKDDGFSEEELVNAEKALASALPSDKVWKILHRKIRR